MLGLGTPGHVRHCAARSSSHFRARRLRAAAIPARAGWLGAARNTYRDYLKQNGRAVTGYPWSGYAFRTVLDWLQEEHRVDLMASSYDELSSFLSNTRGATHYVLAAEHRTHLARLDPSAYSAEDFRRYYNEFHGTDEADLGTAMPDPLEALQQALAAVDENSVIILIIG